MSAGISVSDGNVPLLSEGRIREGGHVLQTIDGV
jgi:hypothetical protein